MVVVGQVANLQTQGNVVNGNGTMLRVNNTHTMVQCLGKQRW